MRATYHTTLEKSPGQLVFGRDMILPIKHVADWEYIRQRKQDIIRKNNNRENSKRVNHTYKVGDLVMYQNRRANKYERPYDGPYEITEVFTNGTVTLRRGAVDDRVNLRHIHPYKTS